MKGMEMEMRGSVDGGGGGGDGGLGSILREGKERREGKGG
jgi:hypothetical protein